MAIVAIDANVLVGLLDERDKWHGTAVAIRDALDGADAELVYPSTGPWSSGTCPGPFVPCVLGPQDQGLGPKDQGRQVQGPRTEGSGQVLIVCSTRRSAC